MQKCIYTEDGLAPENTDICNSFCPDRNRCELKGTGKKRKEVLRTEQETNQSPDFEKFMIAWSNEKEEFEPFSKELIETILKAGGEIRDALNGGEDLVLKKPEMLLTAAYLMAAFDGEFPELNGRSIDWALDQVRRIVEEHKEKALIVAISMMDSTKSVGDALLQPMLLSVLSKILREKGE